MTVACEAESMTRTAGEDGARDTPAGPSGAERSRLAALAARHRLWSATDEPTLLARGSENTTFAVGGYIVRFSADVAAVQREIALLDALASATSVPTPVPVLHEPETGISAYRRLRGTPLIHRRVRDGARIPPALIDALSALREAVPATLLSADPFPNAQWHAGAVQMFRTVRSHLDHDQVRLVQAFVDEQPPPDRSIAVAQHNDLGAEHILVDDAGEVTGIIDWTDAAETDPARDIGSLYRDLGPAAALRVGEALNRTVTDDELRRIRFHARCKWLEDVLFGLDDPHSRAPYLENARITFRHTFADAP